MSEIHSTFLTQRAGYLFVTGAFVFVFIKTTGGNVTHIVFVGDARLKNPQKWRLRRRSDFTLIDGELDCIETPSNFCNFWFEFFRSSPESAETIHAAMSGASVGVIPHLVIPFLKVYIALTGHHLPRPSRFDFLTDVQWTDAGVLTACFAFAWIIGFLSFLTPGGLGIREGLFGLLLANYMPAPQATLVALLCRVWMLSAEIVLASAAFVLNRRQEKS